MTTTQAALALKLGSITGPNWVKHRRSELKVFESDGLPTHRSEPGLAVLPGSREEVIEVLKVLAGEGIPFVARGAGTGLSGGALADPDSVLIVLTRLQRILAVDPAGRRATVEPGVINARLSAAVARYGLAYAPDPSSQTACTLGGNVALNAGGPHCLKYGVTSNHITALEVVLPDGEIVELGSPQGEPWGPDLVGLFVGSEGMFGIATRITVRLIPAPQEVHTFLAAFPSIRAASEAVAGIIAAGIVPAALEMMDNALIRAVEASIYAAGYPIDAAAVLIVEVDGTAAQVALESRRVASLLQDHGAAEIRSAASPGERASLWQGRKKAFGAMGRLTRDLLVQDAVVPRSALPKVLDGIAAIGEQHHLAVRNVFHAGDGNLHPNICFDGRNPSEVERVHQASGAIMALCLAAGGTITGEHGVGADKLPFMDLLFTPETLRVMCGVREAFDPAGRANPGKVIPVRRCQEWQAGGIR